MAVPAGAKTVADEDEGGKEGPGDGLRDGVDGVSVAGEEAEEEHADENEDGGADEGGNRVVNDACGNGLTDVEDGVERENT